MKPQDWSTITVCNSLQQKSIHHFKTSCAVQSKSALINKCKYSSASSLIRDLHKLCQPILREHFHSLTLMEIYDTRKLIVKLLVWKTQIYINVYNVDTVNMSNVNAFKFYTRKVGEKTEAQE